jgi:hypothetical protein
MLAVLMLAILATQTPAQATGVVSGRIRLSDGSPAKEMRVSAMLAPEGTRRDAADAGALFSQTQTDAEGRYRLEGIPPGRYYIMAGRVDAPTYYPGREDVVAATVLSIVSGTSLDGIDFTITESSARVPPPGAGGAVYFLPSNPDFAVAVRIRGEAAARVPLMSPLGRIQLTPKPNSNSNTAAPRIVFQVRRGVNGRVAVDSGFAAARSTPGILQTDGSMTVKVSAGEYRFSLDNLPYDYEVKSMSAGAVDLLGDALLVNSAAVSDIDVTVGLKNPRPARPAGRTVSGRILDSATGKAWIAEAVYLSGAPGTLFSDGSFEFHGVSPGSYTLEAREGAPGGRTAKNNVAVRAGDTTADLTYSSAPEAVRVSGRIAVEGGSTAQLNHARVVMKNTGTPYSVAADGTFSMVLRDGDYTLSVTDLPAGFAVKSISSGAADLLAQPLKVETKNGPVAPDVLVTLSALPRFRVRGRLVASPPTRPVAGAAVLFSGVPQNYNATVAADGSFELPAVLPGSYTLSIRHFGFGNVNVPVMVSDRDVNIEVTGQPLY